MYLLFDIGGTKMRFAVSEDKETFSKPKVVKTPDNYDNSIKLIGETVQEIKGDNDFDMVAGGIRGVWDKERKILKNDTHLTDWIDKPFRSDLEKICSSEIYLENDTAMVGLGESIKGAGRGYKIVVYITISTGVGGAKIVEGRIDPSHYNYEPGHQIIDVDGTVCPDCGNHIDGPGGLEALVSGGALEKKFGKKPYEIEDESVWEDISKLVAYGLNNSIVHWSPEVLVLGGGMMGNPGLKVETIEKQLREIMKIYPEPPKIKKAELGDFGGLHGALQYLKTHI